MKRTPTCVIETAADLEHYAGTLSHHIQTGSHRGWIIYLSGELGAGKTTFVRGFLRALEYQGIVKSPTYTLVETYEQKGMTIYHFDLYRVQTPTELEEMGIRDYFDKQAICLIEWPEKGEPLLPAPDLHVEIGYHGEKRELTMTAWSDRGQDLV